MIIWFDELFILQFYTRENILSYAWVSLETVKLEGSNAHWGSINKDKMWPEIVYATDNHASLVCVCQGFINKKRLFWLWKVLHVGHQVLSSWAANEEPMGATPRVKVVDFMLNISRLTPNPAFQKGWNRKAFHLLHLLPILSCNEDSRVMEWLTLSGGVPCLSLISLGTSYQDQYYISDDCLSEYHAYGHL